MGKKRDDIDKDSLTSWSSLGNQIGASVVFIIRMTGTTYQEKSIEIIT